MTAPRTCVLLASGRLQSGTDPTRIGVLASPKYERCEGVGVIEPGTCFERVSVPKSKVEAPRSFADYEVAVARVGLPDGVTLTCLVD